MKTVKSFVAGVIVAAMAIMPLSAQDGGGWLKKISYNGLVSASYSMNFNKPSSDSNSFRVFDYKDHTPKVDVAEFVVQRSISDPGELGFRFDVVAGGSIPRISASSGLFRNAKTGKAKDYDLQQAFVSYIIPVGKGLRVDAGKFVTHVNVEVIEGYDGYNDNFSRSIQFGYAIPYAHTGAKASYPFNDKLSAMIMVMQGWDVFKDNNSAKSFGAQVMWIPLSGLTTYLNLITGPENKSDNNHVRSVYDAVAVWKTSGKITLSGNFDYGTEPAGTWTSLLTTLRYQANEKCAGIVRGEIFKDADGLRTGTTQALKEITITPEYRLNKYVLFRADYRIDISDKNVFLKESSLKQQQQTIAMNAVFTF